jgi:hypothetical protein
LPTDEEASIAEFPYRGWRILRWKDGHPGVWYGEYETADQALTALHSRSGKLENPVFICSMYFFALFVALLIRENARRSALLVHLLTYERLDLLAPV